MACSRFPGRSSTDCLQGNIEVEFRELQSKMPRAEAKLGTGGEEGSGWDHISAVQRKCDSKGSKQNLAERAVCCQEVGLWSKCPLCTRSMLGWLVRSEAA